MRAGQVSACMRCVALTTRCRPLDKSEREAAAGRGWSGVERCGAERDREARLAIA
jgi:hypothetical protein